MALAAGSLPHRGGPAMRRWWHRLNPFRGRSPVQWVYSDRYALDLAWPYADPKRGQRVLSFLDDEGLLRRGDLHRTRRASVRKLLLVHEEQYLREVESTDGLQRTLGFPVPQGRVDEFLFSQRSMVGGTLVATRMALDQDRVLVNLGGGLHHAMPDRGQGFCLFHDVAIAIRHQRERGYSEPILVVDLDVHDGDGTRVIFADDESVHTYSIHNRHLGEVEAVANTSIALGPDVEDELYLRTLHETLPAIVEAFRPGLVFYLAGADPAHDDRLGDWHVSAEGMLQRDLFVMETVRGPRHHAPVVVTLAGGYGHHAWRYSARFCSALARGGTALEPPATAQLPVTEYRRLARHLSVPRDAPEDEADDWTLRAEDLPGVAPPASRLFLDRWSVHAIEIVLEKAGLLERLRAQGHQHLSVEADLEHPTGQTLRLVSVQPERQVLVELRVRRDKKTLPPLELLFVEWLLSQNPGAEFSSHRPELPGQSHPGMGVLRDIAGFLVVACERLELDGVAFYPSQFPLALQAHAHARFVDPVAGGRFEAVLEAVRDLPFLEKVLQVVGRRVVDPETGDAYVWEPTAFVMAVSDGARAHFETMEYRRRFEAARHEVPWTLREGK